MTGLFIPETPFSLLVAMSKLKSYPEEMYELRLKRYKSKKRTKLPHQVDIEICERINNLPKKGEEGNYVSSSRTMFKKER